MSIPQLLIHELESFTGTPRADFASATAGSAIVVGLDGTETGHGASAIALSLAQAWDLQLRVVSVIEPERAGGESSGELKRRAARAHARRDSLTAYAEHAAAEGVSCDIKIKDGSALTCLVDRAISSNAALVVLGQRASTERAPVFSDETVLRVIRRAPIPVLAVIPSLVEQPRRAIAAIDFSPSSVAAARLALNVLQPGGTLLLAHCSRDSEAADAAAESIASSDSLKTASRFEQLLRELVPPRNVSVATVHLKGTLMNALNILADQADADLIAVGTGRRDLTTFNGASHPATTLLRQRCRTVLAVPAPRRRIQTPLRAGFSLAPNAYG